MISIADHGLTQLTLAERPDLQSQFEQLQQRVWPTFVLHDNVAKQLWPQLLTKLPAYQYGLVDADDVVVAVGHCVPVRWDGDLRQLPDRGWDWALENGIAQIDGGAANTLCALAITLDAAYQGKGISYAMVEAMRQIGVAGGFGRLIAPVRPSLKKCYPLTPINRYVRWTNDKREPFDSWLRVHTHVGGKFVKVCARSMQVVAPLSEWEQWTDLRFPASGPYAIDGGLVPLVVDVESGEGRYVEPNVWTVHQLVP